MLRSYMTLALRQLWRNRLYTSLNVLGLAIGLSACWVIFQLVSFEFSFDKNHPNADRLYRVVSRFSLDGKESGNVGVPKPLAEAMRTQVAGVERAVPVRKHWAMDIDVPPAVASAKSTIISESKDIWRTTSDYFKIIPYTWLAGDPANALSAPGKVVLSESRVRQYFPQLTPQQAIGQRLSYIDYNDTTRAEVAGVIADLTYPTDFTGKDFLSLKGDTTYASLEEWGSLNSENQLFVLLQPTANPARVAQQTNKLSQRLSGPVMAKWGGKPDEWQHLLQPLADIHFGTEYGGRANKKMLFGLVGLALFILVLACVNYINLSTAQVPGRAREIGVRKTLGSSRGALMGQFLGETILVTTLALLVAWPLSILFMQSFHDLIPEGTTDYVNVGKLLLFLLALLLTVSLLAGTYPAWLITRLQPVKVLRGNNPLTVGKGGRVTLRKSLIVFQFVIAQVFIVGAVIIGQQLRYAYTHDMGFDRQAVLTVQVPIKYVWNEKSPLKNRHFALRDEMQKLPGVGAVSLGNPPFSGSFSSNTMKSRGRKGQTIEATVQRKYVDTAWLNLYNVKVLAGRNVAPSDTIREFIVNETALKIFDLGTPQQAVGKIIGENNHSYPIVGVVKDFNTQAFGNKLNAVAIMATKDGANTINIKLASANPTGWPGTVSALEAAWKKAYPDDAFAYKFYDDTLADMYSQEQTLSEVVNLATLVAILISCLGLFGLATLTAFQRTKEIGIRKVLGASVVSVVGLLSREFVVLVGIAIVIATPLAGWLAHRWLATYAYRIDLAWWLFAGAAALALVIALVTVSFQSIRAAVANPVDSLRSE